MARLDHTTGNHDGLLVHVSHRAMATEFEVMLPQRHADAVEAVVESFEILERLESALTIYRDDSEIARLNREGFAGPVPLSESTIRVLERSVNWSQQTDGAFDVTAGQLVEAWGFTTRSGRKPTPAEIADALDLVGYRHLELDADNLTARFHRAGVRVNLGAIGKGAALDALASHLRHHGIADFLIHGGSSSVIAAGDQIPDSGQGWNIGISHPSKPKQRLGGIRLHDQALSTSGSGKQFFHFRGRRYGHVIDPRTGYPAGDLRSLTVVMPAATDADACSTALFVMGSDEMRTHQDADWFPQVIAIRPGQRQDDLAIECLGCPAWIPLDS